MLRQILENLTQEDMERLSDQYDMEAVGSEPWKKNLIRGSDDHSSLRIGRVYTEVEKADGRRESANGCRSSASSVKDFLAGLQEGRVSVGGEDPNPKSMAQTIYSVAYQFYKTKFHLDRFVSKDLLLRFADRALTPSAGEEEGVLKRFRSAIAQRRCNQLLKSAPATMKDLLQKEAAEVILEDPMIREMIDATGGAPWKNEEIWFRFVDLISEKVLKQFADSTLENLSGANLFDIFQTIGSAASLYALLSPYFVGYTFFTRDRRFCENYRERFRKEGDAPEKGKAQGGSFHRYFL